MNIIKAKPIANILSGKSILTKTRDVTRCPHSLLLFHALLEVLDRANKRHKMTDEKEVTSSSFVDDMMTTLIYIYETQRTPLENVWKL